jgi:hypothetical protein
MNTDTPRTDKAEYTVRLGVHKRKVVRPELCRELERELAAAREEIEMLGIRYAAAEMHHANNMQEVTEQRDGLKQAVDCASDLLASVTEQRDRLAANNNRVIELLKDGLQTDGSHHKQWYLNEVLKLINADIAKDVEMHWTHDKGIAP